MKYPRYAPLALGIWLIAINLVSAIPVRYQMMLYVVTGVCLILTYVYRTIVFYAEHQQGTAQQPPVETDVTKQV